MLENRLLPALAVMLAALVPAFADMIGQPYLTGLACRIVIFALAAVSLDLAMGYAGMVSFGHGAFLGVGGYTVAILSLHGQQGDAFLGLFPGSTEFLIVVPAAVLVAALLAAIIGALSLRTTGFSFIMITLALSQMVYYLFVSLRKYGGDDGLSMRVRNGLAGYSLRDDTIYFYLCLVVLVAFMLLCRRVVRSRFGMVLRGCRENERRMATLGYSTYGYKLVAFCISGAGTGLAGALLANLDRIASPDMLHWKMSGDLMVMVLLGGIGTLVGPLVGATMMVVLETVLRQWTEHWMVVLGPILIIVVLFARRGAWGAIVDLAAARR